MIAERIDLNIARDFTPIPGPRFRTEGERSGQEFREDLLRPRFLDAQRAGGVLHIDLDGTVGYPTSFLEEAFGGLARELGPETVTKGIEIVCTDEPYLEDQIRDYILRAKMKPK
jgi:hypothetical protein